MAKKATAQELAIQDRLREVLKPGTTVQTILRSVSRSGMSREISAVVVAKDGAVIDLDWLIVNAGLGYKFGKSGIKIGGCGMDMGFALVYDLSRSLYPNGYKCTGSSKSCHSNDHSNYRAFLEHGTYNRETGEWEGRVENPKKNYGRGRKHRDGGYALSQRWL